MNNKVHLVKWQQSLNERNHHPIHQPQTITVQKIEHKPSNIQSENENENEGAFDPNRKPQSS